MVVQIAGRLLTLTVLAGQVLAAAVPIVGALAGIAAVIAVFGVIWLALPVAAAERVGPFGSLRRSQEITKGARWTSVGVVLALAFLEVFIPVTMLRQLEASSVSLAELKVGIVSLMGLAVIAGACRAVVTAIAYYQLRRRKKGVAVAELMTTFK